MVLVGVLSLLPRIATSHPEGESSMYPTLFDSEHSAVQLPT